MMGRRLPQGLRTAQRLTILIKPRLDQSLEIFIPFFNWSKLTVTAVRAFVSGSECIIMTISGRRSNCPKLFLLVTARSPFSRGLSIEQVIPFSSLPLEPWARMLDPCRDPKFEGFMNLLGMNSSLYTFWQHPVYDL